MIGARVFAVIGTVLALLWRRGSISAVWTRGGWLVWLSIGGHKPLAHLSRWERHLLHLPSIRWRLWPRPFMKHAYSKRARYHAEQMLILHDHPS